MNDDARYSILIVDDDKTSLDVLAHILKPVYRVMVAKTGSECLRRAHEDKPDLILLDILMPELNGFQVLSMLKESSETRSIPVICITALNNVEDEEKGFFLGAVDYITKPFHLSIVKARVRTHLQIVGHIRTIERLVMLDALTNVPNRRSFDNLMETEWGRAGREKTPLGLLVIDVDHFKAYNDTYGHPQGDILLQSLVRVLSSCLRRRTDQLARIGGEEFAVLLPNTALEGASLIAEKMRAAVEKTVVPNVMSGGNTGVTISIGATSVVPSPNVTQEDFIAETDRNLYAAKSAGRNRICACPL